MSLYRRGTAVAVAALAGLAMAACTQAEPAAPSTTTSAPATTASASATSASATPSASVVTSPKSSPDNLGPTGYGKIKLGMTADQVKATGEVTADADGPNAICGSFHYGDGGKFGGGVSVSRTHGVVSITPPPGVATQEGIAKGMTLAQVKKVYPDLRDGAQYSTAAVPGNSDATYRFSDDASGKIYSPTLVSKKYDCAG